MALSKVPKVDEKKCIGCGACVSQCPNEAIEMKGGKAVIDSGKCKKTGNCISVCPVQAIIE